MPAAEEVLTLSLRNIEVGPILQQRRPAPTESDPAKTVLRATRDYRVTFSWTPPASLPRSWSTSVGMRRAPTPVQSNSSKRSGRVWSESSRQESRDTDPRSRRASANRS